MLDTARAARSGSQRNQPRSVENYRSSFADAPVTLLQRERLRRGFSCPAPTLDGDLPPRKGLALAPPLRVPVSGSQRAFHQSRISVWA